MKERHPTPPHLSQLIEWNDLRLSVPDDWEVVRYGLDPDRGRLVFVDRRRERCELCWTRCKSEPDIDRLLEDYRGRMQAEVGEVGFVSAGAGWVGIRERKPDRTLTRVVRFDRGSGRLVELVVVSLDADPGAALVQKLAEGCVVVGDGTQARCWSAFGLRVEAPPGLRLVRAEVRPAETRFELGRPGARERKGPRFYVRRSGLASSWFQGDLSAHARRVAEGMRIAAREEQSHSGHAAIGFSGLEATPPLVRWLGRARPMTGLCWACEDENAVYSLVGLGARKAPPDLGSVSVACSPAESALGQRGRVA